MRKQHKRPAQRKKPGKPKASEAPGVRCPWCNRKSTPVENGTYWCEWCRRLHDDAPDEGGDYSDMDPSWRMQREEKRRR